MAPGDHDKEDRLLEIITSYGLARDAGQTQNWRDLARQHPDLAAEIEAHFLAQELFRNAAGTNSDASLPAKPAPDSGEGATPTYRNNPPMAAPALGRTRLGDYDLLGEIARGGMGIVYKARQRVLNRLVALKTLTSGAAASAEDLVRFRQEMQAVALLDHPHIVPIFDVGDEQALPYFSMKLLEGGSLAAKLPEFSSRPSAAIVMLAKVARAMHFAHQRGILHRDLKPANILFDNHGEPYITDFGLAKQVEIDSQLTQSGAVVGTPSYMSPEQAAGRRDLDCTTDVYSLGAILYQILTNRKPFGAETPMATILQVQMEDPTRPRRVNPNVDSALEVICLKCLEKDRRRRYDTALALAEDLERWQAGEPIRARPVSHWYKVMRWTRRRPALTALIGVVVLLLGTLIHKPEGPPVDTLAPMQAYVDRIALAVQALDERASAERILEDCEPTLRGWEWHHLQRVCRTRPVAYPGGTPQLLAFSPDGSCLAAATLTLTGEQQIIVWHLKGKNELMSAVMTSSATVALGNQGEWLARVAENQPKHIELWDMAKGQKRLDLSGHDDRVHQVSFSRDGSMAASASNDATVRLWNLKTGKWLFTFRGHQRPVQRVLFAPDSTRLASVSEKQLKVWHRDGKEEMSVDLAEPALRAAGAPDPTNLAFSSDGRFLATAFGVIRLWDCATGKGFRVPLDARAEEANFFATSIGFREDYGALTVNRMHDNAQEFLGQAWRASDGRELATMSLKSARMLVLPAWSPSGKHLAFVGINEAVLYDVMDREPAQKFSGRNAAAFHPSEPHLVYAEGDQVCVWDVDLRRRRFAGLGHVGEVFGVACSADGKRIASAGQDATIRIWDAHDGRALETLTGHKEPALGVAYSPQGPRLASWDEKQIVLWDADLRPVKKLPVPHGLIVIAFTSDGGKLALACADHAVRIVDAETGEKIRSYREHRDRVVAVAIQAGLAASASADGNVRIWDLATGKTRHQWMSTDVVKGLSFSPDGTRLAMGGTEQVLRIWDVATGLQTLALPGFDDIRSIRFSRDGRFLSTAGDREIRFLDGSPVE